MADSDDTPPDADASIAATDPAPERPARRRRRAGKLVLALAVLAAIVLAAAWTQRERIADNVIARELGRRGIPATYRVERVGGERQVLRDIVVGDRSSPDLTVERAEVRIRYTLGWPTVGRVTLIRPRLYGTYRRGTLSFGTLDPLLFTSTGKAFALPDLDLRLVDGRALLASDYGQVGLKIEGSGNLSGGFRGMVAAAAPRLAGHGCAAQGASYYGAVAVTRGRPRLAGPVRVGELDCPGRQLALSDGAAAIDLTLARDLASGEGNARLKTGALRLAANRAARAEADTRLSYRSGALTMNLDAALRQVTTPTIALASLLSEGTLRVRDGAERIDYQGSVAGTGLAVAGGLDASLARLARAGAGTLLAPLLDQARRGLRRESAGSRFAAEVNLRRSGTSYTLTMPQARWRGGSGVVLADLSRVQVSGGGAVLRLSGNFATGGPGLPRLTGRAERSGQAPAVLRLAMAEYRAGRSSLALPGLVVRQANDGSLAFVGSARASGPLPGGSVRGLVVPIEGTLSAGGRLAVQSRCAPLRFDSLAIAGLSLEARTLTLCPPRGGAIVRSGPGGVAVAFGTASLDLAGRLGGSPVRIASGPVGFAYPGAVTATDVELALGPAKAVNRFRLGRVEGKVGKDFGGTFSGAEGRLFATPLDLTEASGRLRYAAGRLTLSGATFRVADRAAPARFEPLVARDADLTLADGRIEAGAVLRLPASDRVVTRAAIRHDLGSGRGHADLFVASLRFDEALQPADLSRLALGTIANARGEVSGTGRIDWGPAGVTSSGSFSTDRLDFAAAFGPIKGLAGTVRFTDLLGLVTAPDQEVRVASINPGIEVNDGIVRFELLPGAILRVKGASWPFLGGRLSLEGTEMRLGLAEARRYVLVIEGLDAARFVERMGLGNLAATGTFDGRLPLVFSARAESGQVAAAVGTVLGVGTPEGLRAAASTPGSGRIEGGLLTSRAPGGNVSYVGELTYRDLSTMANFAFQTLRSLDYRHMTIALDGALEGDIVTRVRFDGVRQGEGAKRNILTRAVANLPIQFNVNVRAPFYQLVTSTKALYDPAFVKDPRGLGLIDGEGRPVARPPAGETHDIQASESETVR